MKAIFNFAILLTLFIVQAKAQESELIKFQSRDNKINHTLNLRSDHSFEYIVFGDLVNAKSEGTWIIKKNRIVLKSYDEYRTGYSVIKESVNNCDIDTSRYCLFIQGKDGFPLAHCNVSYESKSYEVPVNGVVIIEKGIDSIIRISFLNEVHEVKITQKNKSCKNILFLQKEREKLYFRSEVWKYHRRKIITRSGVTLKRV